jgi:hypothetical protein
MSVWIDSGWFNSHPNDRDRFVSLLKEKATELAVKDLYSKALGLEDGGQIHIRVRELFIIARKIFDDVIRVDIRWSCPHHVELIGGGAGLEEVGRIFDLDDSTRIEFDILKLPNSKEYAFAPL